MKNAHVDFRHSEELRRSARKGRESGRRASEEGVGEFHVWICGVRPIEGEYENVYYSATWFTFWPFPFASIVGGKNSTYVSLLFNSISQL